MDNKFNGRIAGIDKIFSEYKVYIQGIGPYDQFKVRIEYNGKSYLGHTNIQIKDTIDSYGGPLEYGKTEEEALEKTINDFFELISWKEEWNEEDFIWSDPDDF